MHAAQAHDEIADAIERADELIEDIAKQNYDFASGTLSVGSHWYSLNAEDMKPWMEEASLMYALLLAKGWTPPS